MHTARGGGHRQRDGGLFLGVLCVGVFCPGGLC